MSDMHHHEHSPEMEAAKKALRPEVERDERYWRSLDQWSKDETFQKLAEQEFLSSPLREEDREDGWARREFLKLMGASLALGSAGCLRRPVQKIVPYAKQPEEVTLGQALHYSSTWFDGSEAFGILVKTREGRPIKFEGHPHHPLNRGALSARGQAQLLSCYDPDRLRGPKQNLQRKGRGNAETISISWSALDDKVKTAVAQGSVAILTGHVGSPTLRQRIKDFQGTTRAQHVVWEPTSAGALQKGQEISYGASLIPTYRFDRARVIVSVDADFLGTWLTPMAFTKQFGDSRRDIVGMNELIAFDSNYSLTGANADLRIKIKPSQQLAVVMGLLYEVVVKAGISSLASNEAFKKTLEGYSQVSEKLGFKDPETLAKIAARLIKAKGDSLVVAGGTVTETEDSLSLQVAVNALNSALENDGHTIVYSQPQVSHSGSHEGLLALMESMNAGKIKTLIIHAVNPVYYLGDSFVEALSKVETLVYTGTHMDETAFKADFVATEHHSVESWGDSEGVAGIFAIQQPTIRPMYDTRSILVGLSKWAGVASALDKSESDYEAVRSFWKEKVFPTAGKGSFEDFWLEILEKGSVGALKDERDSSRTARVETLLNRQPVSKNGYELVLYPTIQLGQGELANVSWLQELPDPVTKIVWDNYASVSVATAEKLGLTEGDKVEIEVHGLKLEVPSHIQPGLHDEVIAIALGYGRTAAGKVGNGIGFNAYPLVTQKTDSQKNKSLLFAGQSVGLKKTGVKYALANVQGHHSMEGRAIVIEATLKEYLENKSAGLHKHKIFSIWPHHRYDGHKWAMSVDLNLCTGCSACVVACQSENNVPVVGKRYVIEGREMHWIRIDRYYTGDPSEAETVFQPVMCQHCDNAPCETVCPVLATVHSNEGLNEMVYNRCVGTRYCVNNCPYKVRRFNWFNYRKETRQPEPMAHNPEVGVRIRGVMEKCTFCVQRIKVAKDTAKQEARELKDGEIKTACQQTCPTSAIVFGDVNDPKSQVSKLFKEDPRSYSLLEEFNAAPAVRYMTKIRNNSERVINPHHDEGKKGDHA